MEELLHQHNLMTILMYYTRYIPIKDQEIKEGTLCVDFDLDPNLALIHVKDDEWKDTDGYRVNLPNWRMRFQLKPVELYLVSRDIHLGDYAMEILTTGGFEEFTVDTENDIFPLLIADKTQFKIIGKVSKEALPFIKSGMEFNVKDLCFDMIDKKFPSESVFHIHEGDIKHQFYQNLVCKRPDRYFIQVRFSCPTCRIFH